MPLITWIYVLVKDKKIIVPVRSVLFVLEPDGVKELVNDRTKRFATAAQGQGLNSACSTPVRVTPTRRYTVHINNEQ